MIIKRLTLYATAPINDIHIRSYKTHMDNTTVGRIMEATHDGKRLSQQGLSQVAAEFVKPSAESEGIAPIINGWKTERYYWLMETEETDIAGNVTLGFYVGHTNYASGATIRQGGGRLLIDDNLAFFVNSSQKIKRRELRVNGIQSVKTVKDDFSQLLYGSTSVANVINGASTSWRLRPSDIFKSQEVSANIMNDPKYNDHRIFDFTGAVATGTEASSRRNNTPGTYLFDTLNAFKNGLESANSYGGDESNMISEALAHCPDRQTYQDPLFSVLRDFSMTLQSSGQFTYQQLRRAIPYIDEVTIVNNNAEMAKLKAMNSNGNNLYGNVWNNTNTEHWGGSDNATIAAQLLVNAVPTILLESLGSILRCVITNMTPTGEFIYTPSHVQPLSMDIPREQIAERACQRIINELMGAITLQGALPIVVTIDCSIVGETMVTINLNGEGDRTFVMPTFADNTAAPVITNNQDRFMQVSNDVYNLGKVLFEAQPTGYAHSPIITQPQSLNTIHQTQPTQPLNPFQLGANPLY